MLLCTFPLFASQAIVRLFVMCLMLLVSCVHTSNLKSELLFPLDVLFPSNVEGVMWELIFLRKVCGQDQTIVAHILKPVIVESAVTVNMLRFHHTLWFLLILY